MDELTLEVGEYGSRRRLPKNALIDVLYRSWQLQSSRNFRYQIIIEYLHH